MLARAFYRPTVPCSNPIEWLSLCYRNSPSFCVIFSLVPLFEKSGMFPTLICFRCVLQNLQYYFPDFISLIIFGEEHIYEARADAVFSHSPAS
jgi:hypothetical protein